MVSVSRFSLLYMVYNRKRMDIDEGKEWVKNKIKRSWKKLSQEAKEMMQKTGKKRAIKNII